MMAGGTAKLSSPLTPPCPDRGRPKGGIFTFADLCCGIGGFHFAADSLGLRCVFASDIDEACRRQYRHNFGILPCGDLCQVADAAVPDHDILFAGFPCQPFSIIGGRRGMNDPRGTLIFEIVRVLEAKQPKAFVLENVRQLASIAGGAALARIIQMLNGAGYAADWRILDALDFGLPQKRERLIIAGFLRAIPEEFRWPAGAGSPVPLAAILEQNPGRRHFASERIREKRKASHTAAVSPSIWHENKAGNVSSHPFSCALRASASHNYLLVNGERRLTPRELLRLQGFPEQFEIVGSDSQIRKQTGNAVPVPMVRAVIREVLRAADSSAAHRLPDRRRPPVRHSAAAGLPRQMSCRPEPRPVSAVPCFTAPSQVVRSGAGVIMMDASVRARPGLTEITPYETGESRLEGRGTAIKLSSNESPFGPGPAARAALSGALGNLGQYPPSDHSDLRDAIQAVHGFDAGRIVCGAGSDEILGLIAQAFSGPGTEVIHTRHGFLMYPIFARSAGAEPVEADEPGRRVSADAILASCSRRTRLVYIANPSNPTGTMLERSELERLADSLPPSVILVLDGAYAEFAGESDCGAWLAESRSNVVITRTFSKIHGLASLRVGYGFGPRGIMDILGRIRAPFNVSGPAQAAAAAAVRDRTHVRRCQSHNERWRRWMREQLAESGIESDESSANFLLARFKDAPQAHKCDSWLRKDGIIVRRMDGYQLPNCLRISIGSESACRAAAESAAAFMNR